MIADRILSIFASPESHLLFSWAGFGRGMEGQIV